MSKPTCKAESRWLYWRKSHPGGSDDFSRWAKRQMRRARCRCLDRELIAQKLNIPDTN